MRGLSIWLAAASFVLWLPWNWSHPTPQPAKAEVDFHKQIKPVLAARCQPCHFPGGSMHARLPFDQPETIHKLGTKLFSRIRDEKDRALIRQFLADYSSTGMAARKTASPLP